MTSLNLKRLAKASIGFAKRLVYFGREETASSVQKAYIEGALKKIRSGKTHASLGPNISEESAQKAIESFNYLLSQGIRREDVVVDYGCGTMRIGRHLVDYLNKGNYIGMDLDQRLLDVGLELLDPNTRIEKEPTLTPISPKTLREVAAKIPGFVFAKGVLQHVPPDGLASFFSNIASIGSRSLILIAIKHSEKSRRLSDRSWIYSEADIVAAARKAGLELVKREYFWYNFRSAT